MRLEWDPAKAAANLRKHGVPLEAAANFDWGTSKEEIDDRFDYDEERIVALGLIGPRVHVLTYTMRGEVCRIISLRPANRKEVLRYASP